MTKAKPVYLCPFCLEPCIEGDGKLAGRWVHDWYVAPSDENMHDPVFEMMHPQTDMNIGNGRRILPWEV